MKVQLEISLVQSIVKYLETKPFIEVNGLLGEIIKQANEKKAPETEATPEVKTPTS